MRPSVSARLNPKVPLHTVEELEKLTGNGSPWLVGGISPAAAPHVILIPPSASTDAVGGLAPTGLADQAEAADLRKFGGSFTFPDIPKKNPFDERILIRL